MHTPGTLRSGTQVLGTAPPILLQECQQLGIDSGDIRGGLLGLTAELPALLGAAIESLQAAQVTQAAEYYAAVVAQQEQEQEQQPGGGGAQGPPQLLPVLAEVREGRTAPPEPAASEPAAASVDAHDASSGDAGVQVDWDLSAALEAVGGGDGGDGGDGSGAAGISWQLDAADLSAGGGPGPSGISWDVEVDAPEGASGGESAGADGMPAGISWDIDISGAGEAERIAAAADGGGARSGGPAAHAAASAAASDEWPAAVRRLVEDAAYRSRLLDDLFELRAFLMQVQRWRPMCCRGTAATCSCVARSHRAPVTCHFARLSTPRLHPGCAAAAPARRVEDLLYLQSLPGPAASLSLAHRAASRPCCSAAVSWLERAASCWCRPPARWCAMSARTWRRPCWRA